MFRFSYVIVILVFMATCMDYLTRVNLNVGIVEMVEPVNQTKDNTTLDFCPYNGKSNQKSSDGKTRNRINFPHVQQFDWDAETQGIILGAFYMLYIVMQIPSGRLAEKFGGKWIVGISIIGSGIINMATPLVASSTILFIFTRIVLGLVQGGVFPACYVLTRKWTLLRERSLAFSIMDLGATGGSVAGAALAGVLGKQYGWPMIFYACGAIGVVSFFLWAAFVNSSPAESKFISEKELDYIQREQLDSEPLVKNAKKKKVPWLKIFTSGPVLVIIFAKASLAINWTIQGSKFPAYLNDILHIDVETNGLINSASNIASVFTSIFAGWFSEWLIQRGHLGRTSCRKWFVAISSIGSAIPFGIIPLFQCNVTVVSWLLIISSLVGGLSTGGWSPLPSELSDNFTGTLYGIINMTACIWPLIIPYLVGVVLDSTIADTLLARWNLIIYSSSAFILVGTVFFVFFGEATRQSWDIEAESDTVSINDDVAGPSSSCDIETTSLKSDKKNRPRSSYQSLSESISSLKA